MVQAVSQVLEVNPQRGDDGAARANPQQPFKTLTAALRQAQDGVLIRVAPGTYSAASGETFPLVVKGTVLVSGDESHQGSGVRLEGSGPFSMGGRSEAVTVVLQGSAQLRGVTLVGQGGGGVLIPDGRPLLRQAQILGCRRYGILTLDQAYPTLLNVRIDQVEGDGVLWQGQAKGVLRQAQISHCQRGVAIADGAAPLIAESRCSQNQVGLWIGGTAAPVLRQVQLVQNQQVGLQVTAAARPDIGHPQDSGQNVFRQNGQLDLQNQTPQSLCSVGNDLLPHRSQGPLELAASLVPDAASLPPLLLGQGAEAAAATPDAAVTSAPETSSPVSPQPPVSSRFQDLQGHWAAAFVEALADRQLITGFADGTFRPDQWVKRSEFAALVVASYPQLPPRQPPGQFADVPADFWAYTVIAQAQARGLLGGFPDNTFRPDQTMTRIQSLVAIANGLALPAAAVAVLNIFRDRSQIPSYALAPAAAATHHRLVVNFPDPHVLRPLEPITRAEVAALVYQGLVAQGEAPTIASPAIVRPDTTLPSFTDIQGHWAEPFIVGLTQQNLISGYADGKFRPDVPMTRAQYAALLSKTFDPQPRQGAIAFVDVPADHWAADAIQKACGGGFLSGFPDHTFSPDGALLRVQTWVSLISGLEFPAPIRPDPTVLRAFADAADIPAYAVAATAQAQQRQLLVNAPDPTRLHPNQTATRADIAAIVYQALVAVKRLPAIASPYIA